MAYENDILTRNDDDELSVRVVQSTGDNPAVAYDDVYTRDDNGKLAVRVVGAGGGDTHNKGYFATPEALRTAYPTAQPGDFAIVESTDTVWVWDSDTSDWKDSDTKGQVTSVNNQTGAVTLGINDVAPTQTGKSGYVLGTDGFVAGWVKPEIVQVSALPAASEDEVGNIYQFIGTTDANYTNGYFYKCVSDGQDPATYSWTQTDVQPSSGGQTIQYDTMPTASAETVGKIVQYIGATDSIYTQGCFYRGNSYQSGGQTYYNWSYTTPVPNVSAADTVFVGKESGSTNNYYSYNIAIGRNAKASSYSVAIGQNSYNSGGSVAIGGGARATKAGAIMIGSGDDTRLASGQNAVAIGSYASATADFGIAVGGGSKTSASYAIQLGGGTNSTANTFSVGLSYLNNYRLLDADGTIPTDRFTTTPSADGTYVPILTISSGTATRAWGAAASAPVVPATMPTLAVADWSSNTQTVNVTGVTASNIVFVSPAPASAADYAAAGIVCTAQGSGTLTFTCTTVPSNAITVNVVILG